MRLPTYGKPRIIDCVEDGPIHLGLPRGCLEEVENLLQGLGVAPVVEDLRFTGHPLNLPFQGELRPDQKAAARAMLSDDTGVLVAATGFGKTVIAAWLIAERGVNTLVVVYREQLLERWVERLRTFLDIDKDGIGRYSGRRKGLILF